MESKSDKKRGVYSKYNVSRTDGSSAAGGKHQNCTYFVLDLEHDEYAVDALRAYAKACRKEYPALADDLTSVIETLPERCGCREASCPHNLSRAFAPQSPNEAMGRLLAGAKEP